MTSASCFIRRLATWSDVSFDRLDLSKHPQLESAVVVHSHAEMSFFAKGLAPPYYAVVFASQASDDTDGYAAMASAMVTEASRMDGYLGIESVRDANGFGITVSYWRDETAIKAWKAHAIHLLAQQRGKDHWYEHYELRVAKVERAYSGPEGR